MTEMFARCMCLMCWYLAAQIPLYTHRALCLMHPVGQPAVMISCTHHAWSVHVSRQSVPHAGNDTNECSYQGEGSREAARGGKHIAVFAEVPGPLLYVSSPPPPLCARPRTHARMLTTRCRCPAAMLSGSPGQGTRRDFQIGQANSHHLPSIHSIAVSGTGTRAGTGPRYSSVPAHCPQATQVQSATDDELLFGRSGAGRVCQPPRGDRDRPHRHQCRPHLLGSHPHLRCRCPSHFLVPDRKSVV